MGSHSEKRLLYYKFPGSFYIQIQIKKTDDKRTKIIYGRTPESAAMVANTRRAMAITARLNRLTFNDADEVRALFSQLIEKEVDKSLLLIPPFYTSGGSEICVGRNVFIKLHII